MTGTQIGLLAIQGVVSCAVATYVAIEWFKGKREQQKYKLYALRDALLEFVITGKLSEDDPLFKVLYRAINKGIEEIKDLTFVSFVAASIRAKSTLEQQQLDHFQRQLDTAIPEVRRFVISFAETWMEIIRSNSIFILLLLRVGMRGQNMFKPHARSNLFKQQRREVQTYRYFEQLHDCAAM